MYKALGAAEGARGGCAAQPGRRYRADTARRRGRFGTTGNVVQIGSYRALRDTAARIVAESGPCECEGNGWSVYGGKRHMIGCPATRNLPAYDHRLIPWVRGRSAVGRARAGAIAGSARAPTGSRLQRSYPNSCAPSMRRFMRRGRRARHERGIRASEGWTRCRNMVLRGHVGSRRRGSGVHGCARDAVAVAVGASDSRLPAIRAVSASRPLDGSMSRDCHLRRGRMNATRTATARTAPESHQVAGGIES